jgi:methylenetetrahydrofolate reductase (NADPH)
MGEIFLEIVPRDKDILLEEARAIKSDFPAITGINIPDLLRFETRSWEAAKIIQSEFANVMPHLRAIDFDINNADFIINIIKRSGIKKVLIIKGDPPDDMTRVTYQTTSIKLIKKLKKEMPYLKIYAAIDQYRAGIKEEFDYIELKKEAGADGFFTQPFFDIRLIDIFSEKLKGFEVYFGVSPVVSERSKSYWESRNRAYFPSGFKADMEWNAAFGRDVIGFCEKNGFNLYLMPIKINLKEYLKKLFNPKFELGID